MTYKKVHFFEPKELFLFCSLPFSAREISEFRGLFFVASGTLPKAPFTMNDKSKQLRTYEL